MPDTPDTPEAFHVKAIRQDITDPDKAGAELHFVALSDGDMEMTVRWGDPPRDRGTYLIPGAATADMLGVGSRMFLDRHEWRYRNEPEYRAYMDGLEAPARSVPLAETSTK